MWIKWCLLQFNPVIFGTGTLNSVSAGLSARSHLPQHLADCRDICEDWFEIEGFSVAVTASHVSLYSTFPYTRMLLFDIEKKIMRIRYVSIFFSYN